MVIVVDGGSQAGKGQLSTAPATKFALQGPQRTAPAPATVSENEPHVQKVTIHCTCHEIRACRRPPPCPKCFACHNICASASNCSDLLHLSRKVDFGPPKHEVSLAPAMKSDDKVQKCARHYNESAHLRQAPSQGQRFARPCAKKLHLYTCRKNPSVWTHCLGKEELEE